MLTDHGIRVVENTFGCGNLFADQNLELHAAVQDSLHAHTLLRRDVDYLVKDGVIESVDEFKGRIVQIAAGRRGCIPQSKPRKVLHRRLRDECCSITLQNLVNLYPFVSGMTGTAATQAEEFLKIYDLNVEAIPTQPSHDSWIIPMLYFELEVKRKKPSFRDSQDSPDRTACPGGHSQRRRVGTAEQTSAREFPHHVLNARNDEVEAAIVATAGKPGVITISTNMAGRGTDIQLGDGVAELGGLHVIGTNRHESRRIDNQLRGRAGRQGDPGSSQFFVSYQDDLLVKYGIDNPDLDMDPESVQRRIEGQQIDIRKFLHKYESATEGPACIWQKRQNILTGVNPCVSEFERLVTLTTIDDLWAEHSPRWQNCAPACTGFLSPAARVIRFRAFSSLDRCISEYIKKVDILFEQLLAAIDEIPKRLEAGIPAALIPQRGTTWTYITTDQPFGT